MIAFKFDDHYKIQEEYDESPNMQKMINGHFDGSIKEFAIKEPGTGGEDSSIVFNIDMDHPLDTDKQPKQIYIQPREFNPNRQSGSGFSPTSDDEEESECCIDDMDEHATSKKVSLKNIDMKVKLDLENNTSYHAALNNSRQYDEA